MDEDDDNSALDESEQTERPPDTALHQQRVAAWHPILDPLWVIVALFYMGVILVPTGYKINNIQESVEELTNKYDAWSASYVECEDEEDENCCRIGDTFNADRTCMIELTTTRELEPPILIHYELQNFHQNHRSYYKSRDPFQLLGRVGNQDQLSRDNCEPLNKLGNITLNPCGLAANTFFNDIFELVGGNDTQGKPLDMLETGIAWQSDLDYAFEQPDGFDEEKCNNCSAVDAEDCSSCLDCCLETDSCDIPFREADGSCWRYTYPEDDTTQYLYETYPDIISPREGVKNEHFVVWMRIASQPTFRKLYGWIDQTIPEGETLRFKVRNNFAVTRFKGSKTLVVSTTSIFGGKNPFLAPVFIYVGYFCLAAGAFFAIKQKCRPRKLADNAYLHYKED